MDITSVVDPVYLALTKFKRRKFDCCISICDDILTQNPYDQAVWFLKTRAITEREYIDDTELEEEGIAELLLDENAVAKVPRPGTSLKRPTSGMSNGMPDQSIRPISSSGRPITGFARPSTSSRGRPENGSVRDAMRSRSGSRPVTTLGRQVRLGTASMIAHQDGPFIDPERLNLAKYAKRRNGIAQALCDYLIYVEHNPKKALELAAEGTKACGMTSWWWKARLGKCYYQMGLYRDAEKQFKSSLNNQDMIVTHLEAAKVYLKIDQPNTVVDMYSIAAERHPGDIQLILGTARTYDMIGDIPKAIQYYKRVLSHDASNVEAIASLAANHFYTDQPEIAIRFYRRLIQMGINNSELWNNLGLCCFYASQYDMTLMCFERALALAEDNNMADIWYNIGQIAIGIGDLGLAYQAFRIAVSVDANHAESYNNLGVLELRKRTIETARANFEMSQRLGEIMFEPFYNGALLSYKIGDFEQSFKLVKRALDLFPQHAESKELMSQLKHNFSIL
eukprot:TRINITY_DN2297_c0_g1_i1.p1 TRINITY_DN2297_c0_g1~~TRINITY_DN2297_c0_g1_i1.p1  ORF type:complete len:508 (+),score=66.95 TRINITY_DN2297_c0_g1_i1:60-1583(+)